MFEQREKPIKSIPQFQKEDAPWERTKTYALIKKGILKTTRVGGRQYVIMESFRRLCNPAA